MHELFFLKRVIFVDVDGYCLFFGDCIVTLSSILEGRIDNLGGVLVTIFRIPYS